nr:acyl-CoA carboxylase epsilon subunit [Actinokineospora sp. NBRC 105648]
MEPVTETRPLLRVVRGTPDAAELAALTAVVLAAGSSGGEAAEPAAPNAWADRAAAVRRPLAHGPGAWRASAFPR